VSVQLLVDTSDRRAVGLTAQTRGNLGGCALNGDFLAGYPFDGLTTERVLGCLAVP
jgi:hypothetical protein